jgi:hypothetical protein
MWINLTRRLCLVIALIVPTLNAGAAQLSVCAEKVKGDRDDFVDEFSRGRILIPAGAVFDYAGHAFAEASDPWTIRMTQNRAGGLALRQPRKNGVNQH